MINTYTSQILEQKKNSRCALLPKQLAEILFVNEEALNTVNKCWGYGYIFIKHPSNSWLIRKDEYLEKELSVN